MAVSPSQLNQAFIHEVDVFESRLDEMLSKKTITKGGSIILDKPSGLTQQHFNLLKTRYISAGWSDVKWGFDQREGEWSTFKY